MSSLSTRPRAATIFSKVQPAKHLRSAFPSSPCFIERLGFLSSWAGHRAIHPFDDRLTISQWESTRATGADGFELFDIIQSPAFLFAAAFSFALLQALDNSPIVISRKSLQYSFFQRITTSVRCDPVFHTEGNLYIAGLKIISESPCLVSPFLICPIAHKYPS